MICSLDFLEKTSNDNTVKKKALFLNKFLQNFWSQHREEATILVQQVFNFFSYVIKISSGEVDHLKELSLNATKLLQTCIHWGTYVVIAMGVMVCPLLKKFLKEEKRYCSNCVFQDSFNLWELNEIKRDRVKLNNYYSEISKGT